MGWRWLLAAFLLAAQPVLAQEAGGRSLASIRALDIRIATIGHRLAIANLDLCREQQWRAGFAVHELAQYGPAFRESAIRTFGLDLGPGVLALAEGGPAQRAGLQVDDILLSLDGVGTPRGNMEGGASFAGMEHILALLDTAFADGVAVIQVRRQQLALDVRVAAERGCATRFQLIPSRRLNALADGTYVQVTTAIGDYVADDQELAAVLAHEFAHNVLGHRARLDAARVARGFLGNFGRNARLIRETEDEADRLSIYLLDRAGYDVDAPRRFWERFGRRGLNIFGSPTHGDWRSRVAAFSEEAEAVRRARTAGQVPQPPRFDTGRAD